MNYQLIAPKESNSMIEQVLHNRGVKEVYHYLNTTESDILDPLLLDNMDEGVKLLVSHIKRGSRVYMIVDSDVDGNTSSALFLNYLNNLFPAFVQNNIIYDLHEGKQHGLADMIDHVPADTNLVIAIDSASSDYEQHKILKDKGVDVLVLDHHQCPDGYSKDAIVINNQLSEQYSDKSISGVGVVFKFCSYIDTLLQTNYARNYLDLVALGCIADMVSLRDFELRHLLTLGLSNITNPYFKGMTIKNAYSLGNTVTPFGVAFYVAPYINAMCRSGTQDEKLILFESMLEFKAYKQVPSTKRGDKGNFETIVEQACRNCVNVKNRQAKAVDASLEIIKQVIEDKDLLKNQVLCVPIEEKESNPNVFGLMANQLMNSLNKPTMILSRRKQENGEYWYEGSFRSPSSFADARSFFAESGLVEFSAGHEMAGGLGIKEENLGAFVSYCNDKLASFNFTPQYNVDFVIDARNIKDYELDLYELSNYKHLWGQDLSDPLIYVDNITITKDNIFLFKGKTIKITLGDARVSLVMFKASEEIFETLSPETDSGCVSISIVGVCERNSYDDTVQLIIKDYEIMGRAAYYF